MDQISAAVASHLKSACCRRSSGTMREIQTNTKGKTGNTYRMCSLKPVCKLTNVRMIIAGAKTIASSGAAIADCDDSCELIALFQNEIDDAKPIKSHVPSGTLIANAYK